MRYTLRFWRATSEQQKTNAAGFTYLGRVLVKVHGVIDSLSGIVKERNGVIIADTKNSYKSTKVDQKTGKPIWYANVSLTHSVWTAIQNATRMFWDTDVRVVTLDQLDDGTLRVVPLEQLQTERAATAKSQAQRIEGAAELIAHATSNAPVHQDEAAAPEQVAEDDLPFNV